MDNMHSGTESADSSEELHFNHLPSTPQPGMGGRRQTIGELLRMRGSIGGLGPGSARHRALEAAQQMGIRAALVETGKGEQEITKGIVSRETTPVFKNLAHFTSWLLNI